MTRFTISSMTAAVAAMIAPSLAVAAPAPIMIDEAGSREIVRYADLNLNSEAGARVLASRLDNATDRVCGGEPTSAGGYGARMEYRACRASTLRSAIHQVNASMLTAVVEGRRLIQLAAR